MPRTASPRKTAGALLILLLLFLPWLEGGATPLGLFVTHTGVFLLLALSLAGAGRAGIIHFAFGWEWAAALALVLVCVASLAGVDYLCGPLLSLMNVLVAASLAFALALMGGHGTRGRAFAIAVAGACQALAALVMPVPPNMTPMGTFANANQLAAYLGIGALVTSGLALDAWKGGRRWLFLVLGFAALLDLSVIVRAGARGALLAVLLAAAVWIAVAARDAGRAVRRGLWGALLALAILGAAGVAARFDRVSDPYRFDRVGIWNAALRAGIEHPVLGMGPGMFEARAYRYDFPLDREMFRYSKRISSAHSTYLEVLAATGFAGVAALAVLLVLLARSFRAIIVRPGRSGLAMGAVFAAFACLIHGLVETPFDVPAVTLSLLALLVPLLIPGRPDDTAIRYSWKPVLPLVIGVLATLWLGGVLLPYAAHVRYLAGVRASAPGAPAPGLDDAIRLNPGNPLYRLTRARLAWRRDRPLTPAVVAAADRDLEQAQRIDPGNPEPRLLRAQLHARASFEIIADPATVGRAERYYREAIGLGAPDPRPYASLAHFLLAQGRSSEGIELLGKALALEPRYVGARASLTRALIDAGDRSGAKNEYAVLTDVLRQLTGYVAKNGYEEDLMRLEPSALAGLEEQLE